MAEVYSVEVMALKPPEYVIQQYGEYTSTRNDNMQSCFHDQWRCRIAFKSSLTAEFLKRATNRIKEWKSTSTNREKEITEVLSRAVSLCREKRKKAVRPEMQPLCRSKLFSPEPASLRQTIWAWEINVTPTFWVFCRGAFCFRKMAPKKRKKKKGGGLKKQHCMVSCYCMKICIRQDIVGRLKNAFSSTLLCENISRRDVTERLTLMSVNWRFSFDTLGAVVLFSISVTSSHFSFFSQRLIRGTLRFSSGVTLNGCCHNLRYRQLYLHTAPYSVCVV